VAAPAGASGSAATATCQTRARLTVSPELSILRRPDVVADRKQFGHWECDLIQFRKKFEKADVTSLVERVSVLRPFCATTIGSLDR
jgi:IS30 family transposase